VGEGLGVPRGDVRMLHVVSHPPPRGEPPPDTRGEPPPDTWRATPRHVASWVGVPRIDLGAAAARLLIRTPAQPGL